MGGIAPRPLVRFRGDRWRFPITYSDKDGPIDLSDGFTVSGVVRWDASPEGSETEWEAGEVELDVDSADLENGSWRFIVPPANTDGDYETDEVPLGHVARLVITVTHETDGPDTLAVAQLNVLSK